MGIEEYIPVFEEITEESGAGASTIEVTADVSGIAAYKIIYLSGSNIGSLADNTNTAKVPPYAMTEADAIAGSATGTVRIRGTIENALWSWTPGNELFLSTNGDIVDAVPSTGRIYRIGVAIESDKILFRPEQNAIEYG